jgi:membrane protein YqaA with SNARE-associated domain
MPDHTVTSEQAAGARRHTLAGWFALLFAPAVFFVHLQSAYVLVPWSCIHHSTMLLHLVSSAAVLLGGLGTYVAWRLWGDTKREAPGKGGGEIPRTRFMAVTGLVTSANITLVLLGQWAAEFIISPCQ